MERENDKMEIISAACAMDWSIELEKGLRSNNAALRIDAITNIGQRLHQWTNEPTITLGVADIYGLIPGEDRLFANTILLRLANAFCSSDNSTRRSILKIFLLECKNVMKMGRKYNGILSKERVPNYVELLKRVKMVFDTGDLEAKVLALSMFGSLADLAKDSVHIRYIILTSIQSTNITEVKASLFAAGCFCRLSEDFARIIIEMLIGIVSLPQTSHELKLEAIRVFSKMQCSSSITNRAYKAGKSLMLSLQQDELKVEMLSSLSKLALHSIVLNPQQVDLLLSYVTHESPSLVRVLKYVYFMLSGGACCSNVEKNVIVTFLNTLNNKEFPPIIRIDFLRILQKILCSIDMSDFLRVVLIMKISVKSSLGEERHLALKILVNIFCNLKRKIRDHWILFPENWNTALSELQNSNDQREGPTVIVCNISSLIFNEINSLMMQGVVSKQEFTSLLNLILPLVHEYPSLTCVILDSIKCLTQTLFSVGGTFNLEIGPNFRSGKSNVSELTLSICRFITAYLKILDEFGDINHGTDCFLKSLVECIKKNITCEKLEIFSLEFHTDIIFKKCRETRNKVLEKSALEFAKKMLSKSNNWEAYRVGMYACTVGAWFAAAFTFRILINSAKSDIYRFWFKSLIHFTGAESEIKLIIFPKVGIEMVNRMQIKTDLEKVEIDDCSSDYDSNLCGYVEKIAKIRDRIYSSEFFLTVSRTENTIYCFQKWYLSLRAKVLEIIIDILRYLDSDAFNEEQLNYSLVASEFVRFSVRLNNIAKEYDLLAASFMDIDSTSLKNILRQALSCSVLAFCASFALHLNISATLEISQITVLKDLYCRLVNVDERITTELQQLMIACKVWNYLPCTIEINSCEYIDRNSLLVYKGFINGIIHSQNDSKDGLKVLFVPRIKLLSGIVRRWMEIPCTVPKFFFRVRPCVGVKLFIFNTNSKTPYEISTTSGSQLSLNLCIQLKNMSLRPHLHVAKIYCILAIRPSDYIVSNSGEIEKHEMVELYDTLMHHMSNDRNEHHKYGIGLVTTYVCFETNERGHGFSTCLIDVSKLHEGLYPIKWYCCCVDNEGHYWSLLPLNHCSVLKIKNS